MPKLQPLRIPAGWEVVFNKFIEVDIEDCSVDNENWENPVMEYITREREKVVETIEDLLLRYSSDYNIEIDARRCLVNK